MKKIHLYIAATTLVVFTMIFFQSFTLGRVGETKIAVIVNPTNPENKLSIGEVKLIWLRKIKRRWTTLNKNILPVDRKQKCAEQEIFYSKVLGMKENDVESYFSNRQYQNAEKPQDKFGSDAEVIDFVAKEPGAIGFVNENSLKGDAKSKVTVVITVE